MRSNPGIPIIILMISGGLSWLVGMAIYVSIYSCPSKVTILNYTTASSMTSIILQAADKRVMMPHSHLMFHDGTYDISGTLKQVRSAVEFDKRNDSATLNIYTEKMQEQGKFQGQNILRIKKWLRDQMDKKEDVFLSAEETVKLGLADEIFNYNWEKLSEYE